MTVTPLDLENPRALNRIPELVKVSPFVENLSQKVTRVSKHFV